MKKTTLLTVPNILSGLRLFSVPVLVILARSGYEAAFLGLFACALLTDLADGYLARLLHQESELGSRLDSLGDFAVYITTPLCAWLLWPELVMRELTYVLVVIASFAVPVLIGFVKFRTLTSYHTWGAKLSAVLMGVSTVLLFAGLTPWPFRVSTAVLVVAQVEEIIITFLLGEPRSNVPSFWHAARLARCGRIIR